VLAYLSRHTHRVAIANSRLLTVDQAGVTFRWKDYRARDGAKGGEWIKAMPCRRTSSSAASCSMSCPTASPARRLPPHPPLRPVRQRHPGRQHRPDPEPARPTIPDLLRAGACHQRRHVNTRLSLLRGAPAHDRALPSGRVSAGAPDRRRQGRHVMNTASNTTAITNQRLAQPPTCRRAAHAVVSLPSRATRSGRSGSRHPDAAARPRGPVNAPAAPSNRISDPRRAPIRRAKSP
jgi:hypothetical protein